MIWSRVHFARHQSTSSLCARSPTSRRGWNICMRSLRRPTSRSHPTSKPRATVVGRSTEPADGHFTWTAAISVNPRRSGPERPLYSRAITVAASKTPQQLRDIAAALPAITEAEFRRRYSAFDADVTGFFPRSEEDVGSLGSGSAQSASFTSGGD